MMRRTLALVAFAACSSPAKPSVTEPAPAGDGAAAVDPAPPGQPPAGPKEAPAEKMAADTPKTTVAGNTFVAPAEWSVRVRGQGTLVEAPEGGSSIAIYDFPDAKDAVDAVTKAWTVYKGKTPYTQINSTTAADSDGWSKITGFSYDVPPNLKRAIGATALFANGVWTVIVIDFDNAIAEKRGSQIGKMFGAFLPKGGARESFAGKKANPLDKARIDALVKYVEEGAKLTNTPGIGFGLIENGKVVYAGGVGVRALGKPAKVDGNTKFIIASNTKAMTTLMLAKLVDQKKITWDQAATELLPSFKLGDAATTSKVQIKHLICACTGMPRQDLEWLFEWDALTPQKVMNTLGTMQPTSAFGELFQYSNPLAAAAGFIGGHVLYPKLELGAAFDKAMQTQVFGPLKMNTTTFDFAKGQAGNAAVPHAFDVDSKTTFALPKFNTSVIPLRPAGGAWSSVNDMLKYVQMELAEGTVGGKPYIGKDALLARRAPQVTIGHDVTYGMGLIVDKEYGVTVVSHGGDIFGFHSDMMWLPEHGVGAVIWVNADGGAMVRSGFKRKLLEILFDGKAEADARLAANSKSMFESMAVGRKLITLPADPALAGKLAASYKSEALGTITVKKQGDKTMFDFGEYTSEVATRTNPDKTVSFLTIIPGLGGIELVVGEAGGKKTLTTRDGQHEYVFTEQ
jgi:CubicO group peptidase (beta-lactamase class C family)